jgi:hypothetical protein
LKFGDHVLLFRFGVIPILADILADAQKEKVSRIILAVFRVHSYFQGSHSGTFRVHSYIQGSHSGTFRIHSGFTFRDIQGTFILQGTFRDKVLI